MQWRQPSLGWVYIWPYPYGKSIFQNHFSTFLRADSDSSQKSVLTNYFYFFFIPMGTWPKLPKTLQIWPFWTYPDFQFYQYLPMFPLEFWKTKNSLYTQFFKTNLNLHSKKKNNFEKLTPYRGTVIWRHTLTKVSDLANGWNFGIILFLLSLGLPETTIINGVHMGGLGRRNGEQTNRVTFMQYHITK